MLKRPDIVLRRNGSEGEIRDYVKCLTVSGGTLRDLGKHGRDGFARLKRTCRKPGVSSYDCLGDRIR